MSLASPHYAGNMRRITQQAFGCKRFIKTLRLQRAQMPIEMKLLMQMALGWSFSKAAKKFVIARLVLG